ncbi:MAG: cation:proton antiporter [Candidatus Methanoplasma sp.]|jgi:Kef-type K+ transport system membrane component KefB|nr:cation:proton antiporter [Candidatus Methanoplasma sp.]
MDLGSILIMMVALIVLAYMASAIFERFGVPGLIGEIVMGVLIANLVIGDWSFLGMLDIEMGSDPSENYEIIELFAELGVIFLLFSVGLETKVKELLSVGKAAMLVATMGVIVPFIAGFALMQVYDGNMHHALFLGAAMVATSVGITARVIKDMRLTDKKESRIIIGAAVIDDILGMVVLAMVVGMTASGELSIPNIAWISLEASAFVIAALAAAFWAVPKIYEYFEERKKRSPVRKGGPGKGFDKLVLAVVLCLGLSWLADEIGLAAIIGAFLGGMLLAGYAPWWKLDEKFESITALFLSFFFLNVGMHVDIGSLTTVSAALLAVVVILLAVATKYVGCVAGALVGDKSLPKESRNIIGFGMVPRGEVGIIVAAIGLASGAMSPELYGAVVIMAVATTVIASPLLARAFRKRYPSEYEPTLDEIV